MRKSSYVKGSHNALCDICSFKFKRNQMKKTWDNLLVCQKDWEPKHPQLTIRPHKDRQAVRDARPRQDTVTLADTPISADNTDGII